MGKRRPSAAATEGHPCDTGTRYRISTGIGSKTFFQVDRDKRAGWRRTTALFIDAVLWIAKTGAPWRDLPERFGNWNSVWKRFDRWARKGTWRAVFEALQDPDLEWLILDSTVIRAHPAPPVPPKSGRYRRTGRTGVGPQSWRLRDQDPHRGEWAGVAGKLILTPVRRRM